MFTANVLKALTKLFSVWHYHINVVFFVFDVRFVIAVGVYLFLLLHLGC